MIHDDDTPPTEPPVFVHDRVSGAIRMATDHDRIELLEGLLRRGKRFLWAAVLAAGGSLGGAATIVLQHAKASGAMEQWRIDKEKDLDRCEKGIDDLRKVLYRTSDGSPAPTSDIPTLPDRLSLLDLHGGDLCSRSDH